MIASELQVEFEQHFEFIGNAATGFVERFFARSSYAELPAGASVCDEGQQCSNMALLLEGIARVYKLSSSGREVTLYRVQAGESCVLTASCILNGDGFPAMAVTETPVRALLISPEQVREWLCLEPEWQRFIFRLLSHRLGDIISVVEEVAFKRVDVRLAHLLLRDSGAGKSQVNKTHAELAADLGSSREVISRILKDFAERGLISAGRGSLELTDPEALRNLAQQ